MEVGLVSICSPCYNVAPYISRFLDSLLAQTYKHLEIILVNDGSTDETGTVIESCIPRLEAEGYKVIYLVQENGGQSLAINNALKHVHGEFLTWPDPDDWLTPDSIEKRVEFLQRHPEVAIVRGNVEMIREADAHSMGTFEPVGGESYEIQNFAEKLVLVQTWYAPVTSMIRMSCFLEVNPAREIYVTRGGGQNLQIMLPVAHRFPNRQLPEILGYYLQREGGHSRSNTETKKEIIYLQERRKVFLNTLKTIPELEARYTHAVDKMNCRPCFWLSLQCGEHVQARQYIPEMHVGTLCSWWLYALSLIPTCLYSPMSKAFLLMRRCARAGMRVARACFR